MASLLEILPAKASYKTNTGLKSREIDSTFWWKEIQGHIVMGMDNGELKPFLQLVYHIMKHNIFSSDTTCFCFLILKKEKQRSIKF